MVHTGMERVAQENILTYYPNPFSKSFQIEVNSDNVQAGEVMMFDLTGKLRYSYQNQFSPGLNKIEINGQTFQTGIYIGRLQINNSTYYFKVVKCE